MTSNEENDDHRAKSNWVDQVNPELQSFMIRYYPTINFNHWLKINITHAFMCLPGPTRNGVSSTKIPGGIGMKYFPKSGLADSTSAVLYLHGGGRIMGSSSGIMESELCSEFVQLLNVPVVSANYRLAPNHPFPAALDDVVDAYKYLVDQMKKTSSSNGEEDELRILVVGESAGGGLAAELSQRLLDESKEFSRNKLPLPVALLLINPMLDDRTSANFDGPPPPPPHLVWNHTSNLYAWNAYLGEHKAGQAELPAYAAAARRKDMKGLPPAWIAVGDLDLMCPESREYSDRLAKVGVDTKYEEVKGGFHGMLSMGSAEAKPVVHLWKSFQEFGNKYLE